MTQVLCRLDHENKPVVFVADSLNNGRIKAWHDGDEKVKAVGVDYYQATKPLSEADSQLLAKKFSRAMKDETVIVRQRLPRVYKTLPNILAGATETAVQVATKGKKGKSSARSEAAKKRVELELQQTAASIAPIAPEASQAGQAQNGAPSIGLSPDDPRFAKLVTAIAEILKPML